jgi:hypothetical protein
MANDYLVQEEDGTSTFTLEDDSGFILLEESTGGGGGGSGYKFHHYYAGWLIALATGLLT